jgi:hypothetical protein
MTEAGVDRMLILHQLTDPVQPLLPGIVACMPRIVIAVEVILAGSALAEKRSHINNSLLAVIA